MKFQSVKTSGLQKIMLTCLLISLLPACGWFRKAPHVHQESHRHEHEEAHSHDANPEDLWSVAEYPSSDNLYRLMGLIAATVDTADHGRPTQADMFLANFSDAYHPPQADSQTLASLRQFKGNCQVYISADAVNQESRVFVPRMARLLDQMRFDSASLFYRGQGLSGNWLNNDFPNLIPLSAEVPYACIIRQGKLLGMLLWEDRNRMAAKLLELLRA